MDQLARIQRWYADQCDGDWEHTYGIKLDTLDNPGWLLYIDLSDTELAEKPFEPILRGDSEDDLNWLHCKVAHGKFEAAGGSQDLQEMLETFLQWAGY
jgi:hypothetical protein